MSEIALLFLLCAVSLAAAAFCAGAETAFLSVTRGRILHLARAGSAAAAAVQSAIGRMGETLVTLLIGNNLAHVVFSSSAAALGAEICGRSAAGRTFWTAASAFAVLYLGEFLPKLFCASRPLERSLSLARGFTAFSAAMKPLTKVATALTGLFSGKDPPKEKVTGGEILRILEDRKDGVRLSDFESVLISRLLVLRRKGEAVTVDSLLKAIDEEDV
jgi:CBS domain containing-hemolysin-like protein